MEAKMKAKIVLIAIIAASFFIGCVSYGPAPTPTPTPAPTATPPPATPYPGLQVSIEIKGFAFNPQTITVNKGTNVTWTNKDSVAHTVKSLGNFESPVLQNGQSWSYTFNETGTFGYNCGIHPSMTGKVLVQ